MQNYKEHIMNIRVLQQSKPYYACLELKSVKAMGALCK